MMYYVLVLLFAAHIALFWYGYEKGDIRPLFFAIVLALFTTFAPLYPGIEVPRDTGGVMAVQDPSTAVASFVLLIIYTGTAIRMNIGVLSGALSSGTKRKVKPRWP